MAYCVPPTGQPEVAIFYQSATEALGANALNPIGFDSAATFNSPIITNNYTASPDQSIFVVNASGLYQMEAHVTVAPNGASWTDPRKQLYFQVTRNTGGMSPPPQAVIVQTVNIASGTNYSIGVVATFPLIAGDQVQVIHQQNAVTGNPLANGLLNQFDWNTYCSFTFIKAI